MTIDYYKQLSPHAFGTITHTVFVTVNGNEEYDMIQFTMTGNNPIRLMMNIAHLTFHKISEAYEKLNVEDVLIDVYTQDSDEHGSFSTNVLRTNLDEMLKFLWDLGMGHAAHSLEFLSMDIDNRYPESEADLVGVDDGDFDPDYVDEDTAAKRSYLFDYGPTL